MAAVHKLVNKQAHSLIEVLVSLAIVSLVFITLNFLLAKSLSLSSYSRDRIKAKRIMQDTMEYFRQQRDGAASWPDFVDTGTCSLNIPTPTPAGGFSMKVTEHNLDEGADNCENKVKIEVDIGWNNDSQALNESTIFSRVK